jgi:DNA repair photolyase
MEVTPLLWVCEIVFGAHTEDVLPANWADYVTQDAKKVIESLNYKLGKETKFAQLGDVAVFIGSKPNEKTRRLEEEIAKFSNDNRFRIRFQTAV